MEGPDIFDRGDFVACSITDKSINEDRLYDPDGITEPEIDYEEEEV
jgi:hypothetical protein